MAVDQCYWCCFLQVLLQMQAIVFTATASCDRTTRPQLAMPFRMHRQLTNLLAAAAAAAAAFDGLYWLEPADRTALMESHPCYESIRSSLARSPLSHLPPQTPDHPLVLDICSSACATVTPLLTLQVLALPVHSCSTSILCS
jgi:hypothetical protein